MRIVFFGSSQFSCMVLAALREGPHEIAAVVTQPDQPKGRRMQLCPTVLCQEAGSLDLPVFKPQRLRSNEAFLAELAELKPDALLVASYGQIIPRAVLKLTPWPLNVHPSLLPLLRGASPIRSALLQGLSRTGCCIMRMTPRLDDGEVLLREELDIAPEWNHDGLEGALGQLGGQLAQRALELCASGAAQFTPQDHALATYTRTFTRTDTLINWAQPAQTVYNFIRAWDPDIGALAELSGGRKLKVWRASLETPPELVAQLQRKPALPGTLVRVDKRALWVAAGDGALQLLEVQPENKARMPVASFLAGTRLNVGDQLCVE